MALVDTGPLQKLYHLRYEQAKGDWAFSRAMKQFFCVCQPVYEIKYELQNYNVYITSLDFKSNLVIF